MAEKRITVAIKASIHKKVSMEKIHTGVSVADLVDKILEHYFSLPAGERRAMLGEDSDK